MKSWKTSILGLGAILTAIGAALTAVFDADPATTVNIEGTFTAIMAGVGLLFARDNNVSSEDAGVKK